MRLHASCVAIGGKAVLITGRSGAGKSALTLELMALGAELVADDQTEITLREGWPFAQAPAKLHGLIEARGIGILSVKAAAAPVAVRLAIDLNQIATDRMPPERFVDISGQPIPQLHKVESRHFPAAILAYLVGGGIAAHV